LRFGAELALEFGLAEPLLEPDRVARHRDSPSNRRVFMVCTGFLTAEEDG
jgi:hypothetical protein